MAIFSFYVWENTMENFHNQIKLFGWLDIVVNSLIATSAVLGLIGIHKKIPVLVRIWAFGLACYLGYWICWIIILAVFANAFSVSDEVSTSLSTVNNYSTKVAYTVTAISVLFCAAAFYFVYMLSSLAHTLRKGYPSFKGSQVLIISIKSGDTIFK